MENDYQKYLRRELLRLKIEKMMMLGLRMDDIPEVKGKVVIYGAGIIGKLLFRCFDKKPEIFVDQKLGGEEIGGVPVLSLETAGDLLNNGNETTIIVTPVWDFERIRDELIKQRPFVSVISLEKLLEKL